MSEANSSNFQPTQAKERVVFLDILRGFALMGILFANILSWSGLKFLPIEDIIKLGNIEVDRQIYHYLKFFVDTKFYTIFSILFGVGFYLQISRNKDNPDFPKFYMWRLTLLLLIGLFHALIWSGDIISLYALMGMVLLALRKVPDSKTLVLGLSLFFLPVILDVIYMFSFASTLPELPKTALTVYPDMTPQEIVKGYNSTDLYIVLKTNFYNLVWRWFEFIPDGRPLKVLGLFLLGYFLYSINFFTTLAKEWKFIVIFFVIGIAFTQFDMMMKGSVMSFSRTWLDVANKIVHEIGQLSLALAYICILARLVYAFPNFIFFKWLKNYGRMSMTSYLGHTFFSILVFYPVVAWDFFGELTLAQTYLVGLTILAIQLILSNVWFLFFNYGLVEWIWRCASYRKWFPLKIKDKK
jgi:uncharacterized protein